MTQRKQKPARLLATVLLAVVVGVTLAVLISWLTPAPDRGRSAIPPHYLVNEPAPDFTLPGLEGGEVKLSELRGKVVVLDFWATWCPPCVETLPGTHRTAQQFADRGVVLYAVNVSDSPDEIRAFLARQKLEIGPSVLLAAQTDVPGRYAVQYIPQLFVIDARGVVHAADSSSPEQMQGWLRRSIESALVAGERS